MSRHHLIVGGGRIGRHTAAQLRVDRHTVTVIERDPEQCEQFPGHQASRVIEGDGTDVDVFREANPTLADVVLALTNDTGTNLAVCELASELVPGARTVLRIARDGEQDYAHLAHVDSVVYPAAAGARAAVECITGGET